MQALDTAQLIAIAAALGWASGLRLYLVVFLTGMAGFFGWVELPQGLKLLQHPAMLGTCSHSCFWVTHSVCRGVTSALAVVAIMATNRSSAVSVART